MTINVTNERDLLAIQPATNEDIPFLIDVFLRAMRDHITAARGYWDEAKEQSQFLEQLQLQNARLVEYGGVRIGFFMSAERDADIELHTLCLAPEHQRRGFGTALTRQIIDDARAQNRCVVLSVLKVNNTARSLYQRLGFVLTEETAHHYHMRLAP